jgi:hypothetical protein
MPQIQKPGSGHAGPAAVAGWQWLPFTDAAYLKAVNSAFNIINTRIKGHAPCNQAFQALPGGRTFAAIWSDPAVWVSYDPGGQAGRFGATLGNEVTISRYACRMGHWTLVATLVHELAHVDGAGGGNADAEDTLKKCLMGAHYDPHIIGSVRSSGVSVAAVNQGMYWRGGSGVA